MKPLFPRFVVILVTTSSSVTTHASVLARTSLKDRVSEATAICRGTVVQVHSFRDSADGGIKTEALIKVAETLKGIFPPVVRLVHDGGTVDGEGMQDGLAPRLRAGEQRLFLLTRRHDGYLGTVDGFAGAIPLSPKEPAVDSTIAEARLWTGKGKTGADVTDQAVTWSGQVPEPPVAAQDATGLLVDGGTGVPSRYLQPDRDEAIEYIVDAETLPTGLTLEECLGAATNAFTAWSTVTGITFKYVGLQNFGQASADVSVSDQRIRLQFHDLYNYISSTSTLGRGGRAYSISGAFPNGGMGGNVAGQEYYPNTRGYVVLNHRSAALQNLSTFEEVLCHELGHALGLAHSSENQFESDNTLRQAMMFYLAHTDGRGATLGVYDPPVVQKVHPPVNTPPYGYDRVLDVVTASPQPNVPGINSVEINGFDRQGETLTVALSNESLLNGSFSLEGNLLAYNPDFAWSDTMRFDPAGPSYRDSIFLRYSDGINQSPFIRIKVLSYNFDNQPSTSDGIPNWWAQQYFGSATPSAGNLSRAGDDKDGDGLTNLQEWMAGTDPTVSDRGIADSGLQISAFDGTRLDFSARPYELYEVLGSTDLVSWSRVENPTLPTTSAGSFDSLNSVTGTKFFQVRRVP